MKIERNVKQKCEKRTEILDDFGRLLGGAIELPHQVGGEQRGSVEARGGNVLAVAHHLEKGGGGAGDGGERKREKGRAQNERDG